MKETILMLHERTIDAFVDELVKIAGEMHGATRIGRKPIGVERYLEREAEAETSPSEVVEAVKTASPVSKGTAVKAGVLMATGAGLYHQGNKTVRRYRLGREIERQQGGAY